MPRLRVMATVASGFAGSHEPHAEAFGRQIKCTGQPDTLVAYGDSDRNNYWGVMFLQAPPQHVSQPPVGCLSAASDGASRAASGQADRARPQRNLSPNGRLHVLHSQMVMSSNGSQDPVPQASLHHLAAMLRSAVDAIISIDAVGIIESVNPATETLFGYAAAELVGQNVKILMPEGSAG